jgi:hypothetical protein
MLSKRLSNSSGANGKSNKSWNGLWFSNISATKISITSGDPVTVQELMRILVYFPDSGQDVPIRVNGANLEDVQVTDDSGKLGVNLRTNVTVRNYSRTSAQDWIAASDGRRRQVLKTITDRAEIQKITKASASRQGHQIR